MEIHNKENVFYVKQTVHHVLQHNVNNVLKLLCLFLEKIVYNLPHYVLVEHSVLLYLM